MSTETIFNPENLQKARKKCGLTMDEIADKIGCTRENLYQYEKGNRDIPCSKLIALSHLYGKSVDYLLGLAEYESVDLPQIKEEITKERIMDTLGLTEQSFTTLLTFKIMSNPKPKQTQNDMRHKKLEKEFARYAKREYIDTLNVLLSDYFNMHRLLKALNDFLCADHQYPVIIDDNNSLHTQTMGKEKIPMIYLSKTADINSNTPLQILELSTDFFQQLALNRIRDIITDIGRVYNDMRKPQPKKKAKKTHAERYQESIEKLKPF